MSFLIKIIKKYNINLLSYIIIKELIYILKSFDFPLFNLKKKENKNYHLSVGTPYIYMDKICSIIKCPNNSIFIDFGCGDGRILKYLSDRNIMNYFYGYEIDEDLVTKSKSKLSKRIIIKNKNVEDFNESDEVFNLISKKNINDIYIYFYNPFNIKIVEKIISKFKSKKKFHIFLVGFNNDDINYIYKKENYKSKKYFLNTLNYLIYEG